MIADGKNVCKENCGDQQTDLSYLNEVKFESEIFKFPNNYLKKIIKTGLRTKGRVKF